MNNQPTDWEQWSQYVLKGIESLNQTYTDLLKEVNAMKIELAQQKMRVGVYGALGSSIPILITLALILVRSWLSQTPSP